MEDGGGSGAGAMGVGGDDDTRRETQVIAAARAVLVGGGALLLVLAAGYFTQAPWAVQTWPWPDGRLSYIFIASIQAAIAAAMLWIGLSREWGALAAGALNLLVMMAGLSASFFLLSRQEDGGHLLPYAIACGLFAIANLFLFIQTHRRPHPVRQPIPRLITLSFALFTLILLLVGVVLILQVPGIMPWPLRPESSVVFGWIFFGDAFYFMYTLLRPGLPFARAQLWSFLAYDLVLIGPLVQHLDRVSPELWINLVIYIAILVYSGLLAIYFLFIDRRARVWSST
jgi:hypothetical protein